MSERPDMRGLVSEEYLRNMNLFMRDNELGNTSFMDMTMEDIQKIIETLLKELVVNMNITSVSKVIPFVDSEHPSRVVIGLYTDEENLHRTFRINCDDDTLFLSVHDITNAMVESLDDEDYGPMFNEMRYLLHKFAYNLGILQEFEEKMKNY